MLKDLRRSFATLQLAYQVKLRHPLQNDADAAVERSARLVDFANERNVTRQTTNSPASIEASLAIMLKLT